MFVSSAPWRIAGVLAALLVSLVLAPSASARPECDVPNPPPICDPGDPDPTPTPGPPQAQPIGHLDEVVVVGGKLRARGWSIDPDTTGPIKVQLNIDGKFRLETTASVPRPDVAAAYPGYGPAHGFDIELGSNRHTRVCAYGIDVSAGANSGALGCGRSRNAFSVMTINLQGTDSTFDPWRNRWARVAQWMAGTETFPDVLALQEIPARKQYNFPWTHLDPADYESLAMLIRRIKERTGATYRIAYLAAGPSTEGILQPLHQGDAVIYNANRVRNTTTLVNSWAVPHDATTLGVHMRKSFPCSWTSGEYPESCSLLDGDGRFWTSALLNPTDGVWEMGPHAAMFELIAAPDRHVLVSNTHWNRANPAYPGAVRALAAQTWSAWRAKPKLVPPIVVGDFNGGTEDLPDFDPTATIAIDAIVTGKSAVFDRITSPPTEWDFWPRPFNPSHDSDPAQSHSWCGEPHTLWGDHCGLFVQY